MLNEHLSLILQLVSFTYFYWVVRPQFQSKKD